VSELPKVVRRSPAVFYAAAVLLFVWYLINGQLELDASPNTAAAVDGYSTLWKSKVLFEAVREGLWMAGTGAMLHVLIGIFDRVKAP
jgi:ABC-type spermidine/putrescine transport system permease subunit I